MKPPSPHDADLIALLRPELGFSEKALIRAESSLNDDYPIQFDLIIEDGSRTYIVELKRIVSLETLSRLGLLKLLLDAGPIRAENLEFIIAGKRITAEAAVAAKKAGIRFVKLPVNTNLKEAPGMPGTATAKLTSPKSWQVVSCLLKLKAASIRQLSIQSGVSYGWTHATVQALLSKGIASGEGGYTRITDINKLLNGIAWERPFERLFARELRIDGRSPVALAQDISLVCDEQKIPCAFTSFTAAEIYTGYSARHDSVYLYLEKKNIAKLAGLYEAGNGGEIAVRIYAPDRDLFRDRRTYSVEGVWLVSPAQLLLDCAGLGYAGRDLTQKLAEIYDQL